MSIVIPTGRSRSGIALGDAAVAARARRRLLAFGVIGSYLLCTVMAVATAEATRADRPAGLPSVDALWRGTWAATTLALALTAVWTYRVASVVRDRGVPNVRPGRIAVAWFIPLVGPPAAIRHIGRFLRELDYSERRLGFWMFGLYAYTTVALVASVVVVSGLDPSLRLPILDDVRRQTGVLWLHAVLSALVTVLAARAVLHADRALHVPADR